MSKSNSSSLFSLQAAAPAGIRWAVGLVLVVWFALVVTLGAAGSFVTAPGLPPLPMALGFTVPLALFLAALWVAPAFREFVVSLDIGVILAIQAWRLAGLAFLALYTYNVLPGGFALPAGLGDMAIAATAPWVLLAIVRRPRFVASRTFVVWNALGMLDLFVAVGTGAASSALATGAVGEITTAPMALLPMLIIPVYLVPIFLMLHVAALMQGRRVAAASGRVS